MEIRIRETANVVQEREFREMHPNTSFPAVLTVEILDGLGADPVMAGAQPVAGPFQSVVREHDAQGNLAVEINQFGVFSKHVLRDWTQEEIDTAKAQARVTKWEAIKAERDRRKAGGVKVGEKWFHSDDGSRIQQIGLVMMGANIPAGLQWKTMDGTFVTMTQALAGQIFQAVAAQDQAIFAKAEQHKTAMEASDNPAEYDFSGGWPLVFGE